MNAMKEIRIEKITLNIGTGEAGAKLTKAMKLLDTISKLKSIATTTKKRIPTWGIRPGLTIGCKVTLRKNKEELIKKLLIAKENRLKKSNFGDGTISFGIPEYIDIPGIQYDVDIGIIGLDVSVTLQRAGYSIAKRATQRRKIGRSHKITKQETMDFMKEKFNVVIED